VTATPPQLAAFQSTLFGRADRGKVEVGQPRNTTSLAVNFTWGRAGLNLNERRFGSTSLLDVSDPERDQTVSARWVADVNASYRLRGRLHVSASATNLFDVYPDEWRDYDRGVNGVLSMNGTSRYSGIAPFGINGRTVYLTASYR
jgi:iron complex outermembrane receptor protein